MPGTLAIWPWIVPFLVHIRTLAGAKAF
ncbi:hypothetical protein ALFP_0106 [Alcaligenes faecalis]|nr:hypothetical protein ALFP_0106 [Alcaligenes faecalis]